MTTLQDYIHILQIFYAYFGALEDQINKYIGAEQLSDYSERRKTLSIKNDILALDGVVPEKAAAADLPALGNVLEAFGALYVIEGSTLGGQVISKMISKKLDLATDKGLSFFKSYGEDTMAMWNSFKVVLESHAKTREQADAITQSANETFQKFKFWMEKK